MRRLFALTAAVLLLAAAQCCDDGTSSTGKCDILLTGYEPFGELDFNSSWEAIKDLDGDRVLGKRIKTVLLPVVWSEAASMLSEAIRGNSPGMVICFGMGTPCVQLELTAQNERRPYPDNKMKLPASNYIIEGGPGTLPAKIPAEEIINRLGRAGITCATSHDAGGYLCNEAFYTCMNEAAASNMQVAGFVHVPVAPPGSLALEEIKQAVKIIITACIEAGR